MANLPNNPFAELRNLETRVDGRLDMLSRAEANLRGLLDSLREQVAAACPAIERLGKLLPEAKAVCGSAEAAGPPAVAGPALPSIGELSAALAVGVDQARTELEDRAGQMRQAMVDELQAVIDKAKTTALHVEIVKPTQTDLSGLVEAFRAEAKDTLDRVRDGLADRLDLLSADARLEVEPVLNTVAAARRQAEAAVRTAAEGAQADMRLRAEQLRQSIDDISVVLEQRLTQRTAALHQRAEAAMNALKPAMDERLTALLAALESTLQARERDLIARIDTYPQRLDRQLAEAEATLTDRLSRVERHAADMTHYLESKLTARTDELIARLRLKLQHELNQVSGSSTTEFRGTGPVLSPAGASLADASAGDADRPVLQASVFVQNAAARRPNLSPAA